jgi:hypothetical protein
VNEDALAHWWLLLQHIIKHNNALTVHSLIQRKPAEIRKTDMMLNEVEQDRVDRTTMLYVSFVLPRYLTEFYGNPDQGNRKYEELRTTDQQANNSAIELHK